MLQNDGHGLSTVTGLYARWPGAQFDGFRSAWTRRLWIDADLHSEHRQADGHYIQLFVFIHTKVAVKIKLTKQLN